MWKSYEAIAGGALVVLTAVGLGIVFSIAPNPSANAGSVYPSHTNTLTPVNAQTTQSSTTQAPNQTATTTKLANKRPSTPDSIKSCLIKTQNTTLDSAGVAHFDVLVPCRKQHSFQLIYDEQYVFNYQTDQYGKSHIDFDLFLGTRPTQIRFEDGLNSTLTLPTSKNTLSKLSKAAIIWNSPVNLDLHVHEFAAEAGQKKGHIWQQNPNNQSTAIKTGRGYLTQYSAEHTQGSNIEVYTFFHTENSRTGIIDLKVDFESRGTIPKAPFCGKGKHASPSYQTILLTPNKAPQRRSMRIQAAPCEQKLSQDVRYLSSAFPGNLKIR